MSDLFVALDSDEQRNAVAMKALGRSWQELAPLLSEGGARIQELVDKGTKASGITKEMAQRADDFKDQLSVLNAQSGALGVTLLSNVLPAMTRVVEEMIRGKEEGGAFAGIIHGIARAMFEMAGGIDDPVKRAERDVVSLTDKVEALRKLADKPGNAAAKIDLAEYTLQLQNSMDELARFQRMQKDADRSVKPTGPTPEEKAAAAAKAAAFLETGKQQEELYRKLSKSVLELTAAEQAELTQGRALTEGEKLKIKIQQDLHESLIKLTPARQKELDAQIKSMEATDRELMLKKKWIEMVKAQADAIDKENEERLKQADIISRAYSEGQKQLQDIRVETDLIKQEGVLNGAGLLQKEDEIKLISRVNLARDTANALRQVEIDKQNAINALGPETQAGYERAVEDINKIAEARKAVLPDALAQREQARLANELNKNAADEFKTLWSNVESMGKTAFVNLLANGRSSFQSIGQAIKASIIDLLYEITVKKWIINIGANFSSMFSGSGSSSGGGGMGIGDILGIGKLFSGSGSGGGGFLSSIFGGGGGAAAVDLSGALSVGGGVAGSAIADSIMAEMVGGTAAAGGMSLAALGPYGLAAGAALALFGGDLFGGGGGPKDSVIKLFQNAGGFGLDVGNISDAGGSQAEFAARPDVAALTAALNDPTKYDQATLSKLVGEYGLGGPSTSSAGLAKIQEVTAQAAQVAQQKQAEAAAAAQAAADAAAAMAKNVHDLSEAMKAARDPLTYWPAKVAELNAAMGTNLTTIEDWRNEMIRLLDDPSTPWSTDMIARWQQLGDAITNATSAAANSAATSAFGSNLQSRSAGLGALASFVSSLNTSPYLSPLDQLAGARSNFEDVLAKAQGGDQNAVSQLGNVSSAYLSIGRNVYASGSGFQDIFNQVRGGVSGTLTTNQQSLESLLRETPASIQAGFVDQIKALTQGFADVVGAINRLSSGMRQAGVAI